MLYWRELCFDIEKIVIWIMRISLFCNELMAEKIVVG